MNKRDVFGFISGGAGQEIISGSYIIVGGNYEGPPYTSTSRDIWWEC